MKVAFKLNSAQREVALKIIERQAATDTVLVGRAGPGERGAGWCGNVQGYMSMHANFNSNQHLQYDNSNSTLTYTGERCAMRDNGCFSRVCAILLADESVEFLSIEEEMAKIKNIRPDEYHTSISGLKWYQLHKELILERIQSNPLAAAEFLLRTVVKGDGPSLLSDWDVNRFIHDFMNADNSDKKLSELVKMLEYLSIDYTDVERILRSTQKKLNAEFDSIRDKEVFALVDLFLRASTERLLDYSDI